MIPHYITCPAIVIIVCSSIIVVIAVIIVTPLLLPYPRILYRTGRGMELEKDEKNEFVTDKLMQFKSPILSPLCDARYKITYYQHHRTIRCYLCFILRLVFL